MNPFPKIESVAKTIGEDTLHVLEFGAHVGSDVFKVLAEVKALTPEFKTELAKLVQDAEPLAAVLAPVIATKGADVALDITDVEPVLADVKKLIGDFVTFLPVLKTALVTLEQDVK